MEIVEAFPEKRQRGKRWRQQTQIIIAPLLSFLII
jgi:hypothetical protein